MRRALLLGLALAAALALTIYWLMPSRMNDATPASGPSRPATSAPAAATINGIAAVSAPESGPTRVDASSPSPNSTAAASARGRFVDKAGAPVEGVKLYRALDMGIIFTEPIDRLPDLTSEPVVSSTDGVFRWVEVAHGGKGRRDAVAQKRGFAPVLVAMTLVNGTETNLGDFVLEPGGDIAGVVHDPERRPVEGALVRLVDSEVFASLKLDPSSFIGFRFKGIRRAVTGADGAFVIPGVPLGTMRLVAEEDKFAFAATDPFDVKAGSVLDNWVLTLGALPREATIEGRVEDPSGAGVAAAIETSHRGGASMFQTASDGTFRWRCTGAGPFTFLATDVEKKFGGARATSVPPGTRDLRLRLTEPRDLILELVNDLGESIREGAVNLVRKEGAVHFDLTVRPFDPPGRAVVRMPSAPFAVEVRAPGHVTSTTATLDPSVAPEKLSVVLRKLPTIEGRVISKGQPVKGAWVTLQSAMASARQSGFPARHTFDTMSTVPTVETKADGTFSIAPTGPVKLAFLQVSGTRFDAMTGGRNPLNLAPAEFGPFEYDARAPVKGLEIVLTPGGSIAGTLRLPPGQKSAGQTIGASNGDGHPLLTQAREDGSFEFVQLTPGRYEVKWMDGVDFTGSRSRTPPTEVPTVPWNCLVEEGAITTFDLDFTRGVDISLLLEVKLGDKALAGAKARLEVGSVGREAPVNAVLDAEGRARFTLPRGGDVKIVVAHAPPSGVQYEIHASTTLDAHGETRCALSVPVGILRGTVPARSEESVKLTCSKVGAPPFAFFTLDVKPGVPFEIDPAPAGPVHVKLPDGKSAIVSVPAGGPAEVKWP